jgi:endogenous inhibitor of DNA gyrase (YacG/DUF329 family)
MNSAPCIVACPSCGKPVAWTVANAFRPFCSERCRLIDLGAWAAERYRVPIVEEKDQLEEQEPGAAPPPAAEK